MDLYEKTIYKNSFLTYVYIYYDLIESLLQLFRCLFLTKILQFFLYEAFNILLYYFSNLKI